MIYFRTVLTLTMIWGLGACDAGEEQDTFEDEAFSDPSGFTQTGKNGSIQSRDDDDWRISPIYIGRVVIDPAFPNPAPPGGSVAIPVRIRLSDSVQGGLEVTGYDRNEIPRRLDSIPNASETGSYVFRFMPSVLGIKGLIRVFIVDTRGRLVSYGDIQIDG